MLPPAGLLYWYTTSAILALLTLLNIAQRSVALLARRRSLGRSTSVPAAGLSGGEVVDPLSTEVDVKLEQDSSVEEKGSRPAPLPRAARIHAAASTAWTRYVLLSEFPVPSWGWRSRRPHLSRIAGTEAFWTILYALGVCILSFLGTKWHVRAWASQAGWVSIAQIPLIIALAGKNNLVSLLTGVSYEKLNFLHRAAGKVCLAGAWVHTIGYVYLFGGISLMQLQTSLTTWGMISILSFTLMYVLSLRIVRRRIYEFFLVAHICLAALFLAGVIMHWRKVDIWIYPGIALWAGDRILRFARLALPGKFQRLLTPTNPSAAVLSVPQVANDSAPSASATLTLLTPSTLKLAFPAHTCPRWRAGQHFYVLLPGMSRLPWELHPFTAATIPRVAGAAGDDADDDLELAFIVRVRDGCTRRLKERVDAVRRAKGLGVEEECSVQVDGRVEGPYGGPRGGVGAGGSTDAEGVIIFAGGSGISFALAHLLQVISDARTGEGRTRVVRVVWMVKSRLHLNWIAPLLAPHVRSLPAHLSVELHIHITARYPAITTAPPSAPLPDSLPADPAATSASETADWQAYIAQRASEPRGSGSGSGSGVGVSRKASTMSWATFAGDLDHAEAGAGGLGGEGEGTLTRRGSEYTIRDERVRRSSTRPNLPAIVTAAARAQSTNGAELDKEEGFETRGEVIRTFCWSNGYDVRSHLDNGPQDRGPSSPTPARGLVIRPPSPSASSTAPSPSRSRPRTPSRSSISLVHPSPDSAFGAGYEHGALPVPRARKVSFAEGLGQGASSPLGSPARRSSLPDLGAGAAGYAMGYPNPRKASTDSFVRRKPSLGGIVEVSPRPEEGGGMVQSPLEVQVDDEEGDRGPDVDVDMGGQAIRKLLDGAESGAPAPVVSIQFTRSLPSFSEPSPLAVPVPVQGQPVDAYAHALRPPPAALDMSRSSSTQSAQSYSSTRGLLAPPLSGSTPASLHPSTSAWASASASSTPGTITPALAERHPAAPPSFAASAPARRRLSEELGLAGVVRWFDGRVDPRRAIGRVRAAAAAAAGEGEHGAGGVTGGRTQVMVCGPSSLVRAVRDAARAEMSVRGAYAGEGTVRYHEESFGW